MGKKRKRQRPAGETFTLVESNGENLLEGLVLRRDAVTVAEEAELLAFINDGLARGRNGSSSRGLWATMLYSCSPL